MKHANPQAVLLALGVVLAIVLIVRAYRSRSLQWISTPFDGKHGGFTPAQRYRDIVAEFGQPTTIDRRPGGQAVWTRRDIPPSKPYDRVVLIDEQIPHKTPKPHVDFLYVSLDYEVPEDLIPDVLRLSESVYYDRLKKQIWARCHFMGATVATLCLAVKIASRELTLAEIMDQDLYKMNIMSTMQGSPMYKKGSYEGMESYLRSKVSAFKREALTNHEYGKRP